MERSGSLMRGRSMASFGTTYPQKSGQSWEFASVCFVTPQDDQGPHPSSNRRPH